MLSLGAWHITLMAIVFVVVCIFLVLVVLIQKPRGGGLAGAFGGAGGSAQAAFGAKTGDVLTWFTVALFIMFLALAMGLTWAIKASVQITAPPPPITSGSTTTPDEGLVDNLDPTSAGDDLDMSSSEATEPVKLPFQDSSE